MKLSYESTGAQTLRNELCKALSAIPQFEKCALLDYPQYQNAGDHFIWIACAYYLRSIRDSSVTYAASFHNFSNQQMEKSLGDGPIFFSGGGNLGDLWPEHQLFRERVIDANHHRPIVIFPQTIHFQDEHNLERASRSFNNHPSLTIFARDAESHRIAQTAFSHCQTILAPDMVYALAELERPQIANPESTNYRKPRHKTLFLCRDDQETSPGFEELPGGLGPYTKDGWFNLQERHFDSSKFASNPTSPANIPGAAFLYREVWQRRLHDPALWHSRTAWRRNSQAANLFSIRNARSSWAVLHDAIGQLSDYSFVITNRLHGHVLSNLLGIPNILLPNSYGKNLWFWSTWNQNDHHSRFAAKPELLAECYSDLLATP
jgi:Exopolysaccharide biosynthesis protein